MKYEKSRYAHYAAMEEAIRREKPIKAWKRQWKIELIETINKDWLDLHGRIDVNESFFEAKAGPQLSLG